MIVAGLFNESQDLTDALNGLQEKGFTVFTVFGPDELFTEPDLSEEEEEALETQTRTSAGTVSGIAVNPRPTDVPSAGARPIVDELVNFGLGEEDAEMLAAGVEQNQLLLLIETKRGREEEARTLLEASEASMVFPRE